MASDHDDNGPGQYSSPPCFMHELDPEFRTPLSDWTDVKHWRKAERERLIAARLAVSADARTAMSQRIGETLDALIGDIAGRMVSLYWPFRGEPDLRPWMASVNERGGRTALPVVVEKGRPLVFRAYAPGDRLEKGVWNIPIPAEGDPMLPDIVISPIVGIDPGQFRLGYGGGFFDRTLAAMPFKPLVIGVGYELQRIATIYPQPHDIPMDRVVTEASKGVVLRAMMT
ncbi:MAG: 5-formyltetrahydrofolate cyclo-ligase [Mesorhizobium sp.]|uniref:5-formyltetrahydrofolate cyclo-ligase n=1 Tax=Mesorhizobium sp. TaxID=1871066 RepID=UPI000FE8693B|nr:5-formyltetrahydrofolate cyclo-ligase [Mesorhizobium sp.]RWB28534.1 MAG: 5-formyltetrahydrofolate cyclo-ligase [Mesorhizobium sp.]RWB50172.1 MAG: 5-formyltetrahydrofolate cyclo-ligase [Mesorhizobium sp.]RWD20784.1 MAG: 5-formyltetrahydrofolate cyclo-ligase [Mesorhizobium sp.]